MDINSDKLKEIISANGDSFYLLDTMQFEQNFEELLSAMKQVYPKSQISYSYKTNYIPRLCKLIDEHGGYAEVVSEMEYRLALAIGVKPSKIIFNGPYKTFEVVEELLVNGGLVNIDAQYELEMIFEIASKNPSKKLRVALRCNFDIEDGVLSRFGFDVNSSSFANVIKDIKSVPNLILNGLHCHFATRQLEFFATRAVKMLALVREYFVVPPAYISLGGGLFGKMEESLALQFDVPVPTYSDYAKAIASVFAVEYSNLPFEKQPELFIEPGSAIVGDVMKFVAKVINIKEVRGKAIATVTGSMYNINPTLNKKNPPLQVIHTNKDIHAPLNANNDDKKCFQASLQDDESDNLLNTQFQKDDGDSVKFYESLDFGGYTCIESDYLYRNYNGLLGVGDYVIFGNVGSYSIVLKPPFILPNFPVIEYRDGKTKLLKKQEVQENIFETYSFD